MDASLNTTLFSHNQICLDGIVNDKMWCTPAAFDKGLQAAAQFFDNSLRPDGAHGPLIMGRTLKHWRIKADRVRFIAWGL
jgi:hypothetical protein